MFIKNLNIVQSLSFLFCIQHHKIDMSTTEVSYTEPSEWITCVVVGLFSFCINITLLKKEIHKRRSGQATFTTKYLKIWSILCIVFGCIIAFDYIIYFFNGVCYISYWIWSIGLSYQFIFMGFYQLSRLYYCFANNQIHSHKGYPNWVFIIMYAFGITILICSMMPGNQIRYPCGIDDKWMYYESKRESIPSELNDRIENAALFAMMIWDCTTLALYAWKIKVLLKTKQTACDSPDSAKNDEVYARIVSILYKIAIITLFYQFGFLLSSILEVISMLCKGWIGHFILCLAGSIPFVLLNFCMFIMMDHNQETYRTFLRILSVTKFYWIGCCCCCRHMVMQQVGEWNKERIKHINNQNQKRSTITKETVYDVDMHDIKPDHATIKVRRCASEFETIDDGSTV